MASQALSLRPPLLALLLLALALAQSGEGVPQAHQAVTQAHQGGPGLTHKRVQEATPSLHRGSGEGTTGKVGVGEVGTGDVGRGGVSRGGGDACDGRRIYVHQLPRKFNEHLTLQKEDYSNERRQWYTEQMLRVLERVSENGGFGRAMKEPIQTETTRTSSPSSSSPRKAWYSTDQFALEVVFRARLASYPCLVPSHKEADLVYVPYFGGLDMTRHMHEDNNVKERLAKELVDWLQRHPAWERHRGRDHFWVLGRETWDFRKNPDGIWGNNLLNLEGVKGTVLTVDGETTPWFKNDFCAPKPTGFHPPSLQELQSWVRSVKAHQRPYLFSFVAGRRKNSTFEGLLREKLFWQCGRSKACYLGDCDAKQKVVGQKWVAGCESPRYVMRAYLQSTFCLHPRGDSCNRRSVLDSMLAGCIPVVFEECTLQHQYGWHMHNVSLGHSQRHRQLQWHGEGHKHDHAHWHAQRQLQGKLQGEGLVQVGEEGQEQGKFFVHIPYDRVKGEGDPKVLPDGTDYLLVEKELRKIPASEVRAMQSRVLRLIPRFTYGGVPLANGTIQPPDFEDAFNIIVDGLLRARKENTGLR